MVETCYSTTHAPQLATFIFIALHLLPARGLLVIDLQRCEATMITAWKRRRHLKTDSYSFATASESKIKLSKLSCFSGQFHRFRVTTHRLNSLV